jgi:hypothetical protein
VLGSDEDEFPIDHRLGFVINGCSAGALASGQPWAGRRGSRGNALRQQPAGETRRCERVLMSVALVPALKWRLRRRSGRLV